MKTKTLEQKSTSTLKKELSSTNSYIRYVEKFIDNFKKQYLL